MRNYFTTNGDTVIIRLRCSQCGWMECQIDLADLPMLLAIKTTWGANPARKSNHHKHYAFAKVRTNSTTRATLMHRVLMAAPNGREVHHVDNDGLNNKRINLDILRHIENMRERDPSKDWADVDRRRALAAEYRIERAIAADIQREYDLTRQALFCIRCGKTRHSKAAAHYSQAIEDARIRPYELIKMDHEKGGVKWGAVRGGK
jgi:hypothetical protein